MKYVAILLNVAVILAVIYRVVAHNGVWPDATWWRYALILAASSASLYGLWKSGAAKDWLSLFFQRKALEEQRKIDALRKP